MQKLTIREPKKIEHQINQLINNDPESKFIYRLCSLKMFINDSSCSAEKLGDIMRASPRTIANWIHSINATGQIDVLRDKEKPGRNSRLTDQQLLDIQGAIQQHPTSVGLDANLWDGKSLSHFIKKEYGIRLQVRQCQRVFKKLGFTLKRGRTMVANGDPDKKSVFKKTAVHSKKEKL
jgi:transposase